jgi:uncharacterized protein (TIGR02217 family)
MYINTRLDDCVSYGFTGGPEYSTEEVELDNGGSIFNGQWLYPRHRYSAQYMNLRPDARDSILAAFHSCRGRLHAFRFKDWNDYTAEAEIIAPSIGTMTAVQLFKTYNFGGQPTSRKIQAPVAGAIVKRNGTPVGGTLDTSTGLFTPSANWVAGTFTWDGEFDVWVGFESDYNAFTINSWQAHTADIELVERKRLT